MMKSQFQPDRCAILWFACLAFCALQEPVKAETKPRPLLPPWPEETLHIWHFDEPPRAVGDSEAAALVDSAIWVPSWSGYALNRHGTAVNPAALPMATTDRWDIAPEEGAIRFWFKPDWASGAGPGKYARLIELTTGDTKDSWVWWSLYVSPDGCNLYLSGQGPEGPVDFLKADIGWQSDQWHLIALSYDPKGTYLDVDSELVGMGSGLPSVPRVLGGQTSLSIGSDSTGQGVAGGQFDELCMFRKPLIEGVWTWSLCSYYRAYRDHAAKGPVTEAEEAAVRQKAAEHRTLKEASQLSEAKDSGGGVQLDMESGGLYLLTPEIIGTNVNLTLWGGETNQSYNILFTPVLPADNWSTLAIGSMGQTNFAVPMLGDTAFYRAEIGDDWDGDGIPNWIDARPSDPSVGALTITVDLPANGSVLQ